MKKITVISVIIVLFISTILTVPALAQDSSGGGNTWGGLSGGGNGEFGGNGSHCGAEGVRSGGGTFDLSKALSIFIPKGRVPKLPGVPDLKGARN